MSKDEISVGAYTVSFSGRQISMTGFSGSSDCAHTVKGADIDKLRRALGLGADDDIEQHLRTLDQRDAERLHTIFIEIATENFAWWDPEDFVRR